jgi:colanic acid biosynthesis glycosyl transferase WcaI
MKLRILVIGINYAPEQTTFGPPTAALCEYLVSRGHAVTVFTALPFNPQWSRWPEYRGKFVSREWLDGVEVVRLTHFIPRRPSHALQRIAMEGSFCLTALIALLWKWMTPWDVVVYVGTQPSIAMLAGLVAKAKGIPYVAKITDLATQAALDVGVIHSGWTQRLLEKLEYVSYRGAKGIIVLCPGFKNALIARQYPPDQIRVISNPVDLEQIRPVPDDGSFRVEHQLAPSDFVILHAGSMALKQGLRYVVEAARLLGAESPDVKWVLVGDGETRPMLQKRVFECGLTETVRLLPLQAESKLPNMLGSTDLLLLNQLAAVKDSVIPGKLLMYMGSGKPVIAAVNAASQSAALLRESGGGLIVPPEDPMALAAGVKQLQADPAARVEMGRRNRAYAEQHFDRRKIVAAQETFLVEIVNEARQAKRL